MNNKQIYYKYSISWMFFNVKYQRDDLFKLLYIINPKLLDSVMIYDMNNNLIKSYNKSFFLLYDYIDAPKLFIKELKSMLRNKNVFYITIIKN